MPRVEVIRDPQYISDKHLIDFLPRLQRICAIQLSCDDEGGRLFPEEVDVFVREFGPHDITLGRPLQITISANYFPKRAKNIQERTELIERDLRTQTALPALVCNGRSFVWVNLGLAGFVHLKDLMS